MCIRDRSEELETGSHREKDQCRNRTGEADQEPGPEQFGEPVSYTHLRAHETVLDLVCRLLLEKKKMKPVDDSAALIMSIFSDAYAWTGDHPICHRCTELISSTVH